MLGILGQNWEIVAIGIGIGIGIMGQGVGQALSWRAGLEIAEHQ